MWSPASEPPTGSILLAVEAVPQSQALVAAAAKFARQSHAEVLVLSVRERDYVRGYAWDIHQPGEIAETVSRAIYELERCGVQARGIIRTARSGRVADEIVYAAHKHHADEIVVGRAPPRERWSAGPAPLGSAGGRRADQGWARAQANRDTRQRLIAGPKR
jgi:K+-sensing histidine kinase KdpD